MCYYGGFDVLLTADGEPIGTVSAARGNEWRWQTTELAIPDGISAIYFRMKGYTYLEKRIPSGGSIAYVTSCGGLMWEKWRKEYVKVMDCKTWDEMVAFMKSVSPKDGVGVMAYTLSKRAMNYYTSLKAVELGKRGVRVNALLPGSTDTGMKKEFEKMAGGQDNLVKENGGAGRLATPQEMADPLLFLNSDMAAFVSGLLLIADMGHNCEKTLGFCKNQLDVPAALKLYNTKFFQNKLKTNQ